MEKVMGTNTVVVTVKEYCDLSGYSVRNVTQHIANEKLLPHMVSFRRSGATWLIHVDKDWYDSKTEKVCDHEWSYQGHRSDGRWKCNKCWEFQPIKNNPTFLLPNLEL